MSAYPGLVVFVLEGWFGDHEWLEGIYAYEEDARREHDRLWRTRRSERAPEWCQGLCKFSVSAVALK